MLTVHGITNCRYTAPEIYNTGLFLLGESSKFVPISPNRIKEISHYRTANSKIVVNVRMTGKAKEELALHFVYAADIKVVLTVKCVIDENGEAVVSSQIDGSDLRGQVTVECS
jgi:hypothetical protein